MRCHFCYNFLSKFSIVECASNIPLLVCDICLQNRAEKNLNVISTHNVTKHEIIICRSIMANTFQYWFLKLLKENLKRIRGEILKDPNMDSQSFYVVCNDLQFTRELFNVSHFINIDIRLCDEIVLRHAAKSPIVYNKFLMTSTIWKHPYRGESISMRDMNFSCRDNVLIFTSGGILLNFEFTYIYVCEEFKTVAALNTDVIIIKFEPRMEHWEIHKHEGISDLLMYPELMMGFVHDKIFIGGDKMTELQPKALWIFHSHTARNTVYNYPTKLPYCT